MIRKTITRHYTIEPLKQHCINVKKKNDQYYAFALSNNVTKDFLDYIKFCLDRNENIRLNVGGRTRCLTGDTKIYQKVGNEIVQTKIRQLGIGDEVLSWNFNYNQPEWREILATSEYESEETYEIKTLHNRIIKANKDHNFITYYRNNRKQPFQRKIVSTKNLTTNHYLPQITELPTKENGDDFEFKRGFIVGCYLADGNQAYNSIYIDNLFLDRIDTVKLTGNKETVYCIEVEGNHNFFLANGILSMNSGKSYGMLVLCKVMSDYSGVPFTVERNLLFNESEFLNMVDEAKFHEVFLIDEAESTHVGYGSMAEQWGSKDYRRICAKNCIHSISLVGDYSQLNTNAFYKLVTLSRDLDNKITKFLLFNVEDQENIPIGYVEIPLDPILCQDMKDGKVIGCIKCPKYAEGCMEFQATYERKKDTNIDKVTGGKLEERTMIRFKVAQQLVQIKEYMEVTNQKQRKIMVRKLVPELSNRRFTEAELDEVVEITRMLQAEMKKQQAEEPEEELDEETESESSEEAEEEGIRPEEVEGITPEELEMLEKPKKKKKKPAPKPEEEVYPDHDKMIEELERLQRMG